MDGMQGIDDHIKDAEQRVAELIERLEGLRSLEEEQEESNRSVRELARRTAEAANSLDTAAGALRAAVDTFNRADPAKTQITVEELRRAHDTAIAALTSQIESAAERVTKGNDSANENFDRLSQRTERLEETLRELLGELARRRGPLKRVAARLRRR